jgi:hypothetical protein
MHSLSAYLIEFVDKMQQALTVVEILCFVDYAWYRETVLMGSPRKIIKIEVTPEAKEVIAGVAEELDMKENGLAGRIYTWFGSQTDLVQKAILGIWPKNVEDKLIDDLVADITAEFRRQWQKDSNRKGKT